MVNKIATIYAYFETLAKQHKEIKSFYRKHIDEVLSGIESDNIQYPALVVEDFDWQLTGLKSEDRSRIISLGFHIIKTSKERNNFDAHRLAEQECEPIALDLISRIYVDEELYSNDEFHPIKYFNTESIQGQFLGRNTYSEFQFGVRYQVEIHMPVKVDFDLSKWEIPAENANNYGY